MLRLLQSLAMLYCVFSFAAQAVAVEAVKFERRALISQLTPGDVESVVSGQIDSGEAFWGSEIVTAISPGADECLPPSNSN